MKAKELLGQGPFRNVAEVKRANKANKNYWFERDTMQFFNSRIESKLYAGRYFITSERMELSMPKLYTIRMAEDNGNIVDASDFQEFSSLSSARSALRELLKTKK